jgi:diaminohydroxyphosphoribosylaminopyrimidine deaminase/5-amino-6-(5-phosphoribosylamino)uracil reductase
VVGEGFHPAAGEPHAEIFALVEAGHDARGADAYVTLEPCSHHGKTPPCTDALVAAGVRAVHIGMRDPNPDAAGGAEELLAAGVEVSFAQDPSPFARLNAGWLKRIATGMPYVTVKLALSLDGHPAFVSGERAAITGPSGAIITRRLRAAAEAVVVGAATVEADDPALTVRDVDGTLAPHQPLRVVLLRNRELPPDARVFTDGAAPTLVLAADSASEAPLASLPAEVERIRFKADEGLAGALRALALCGISEVLIESGPRLLTALWGERLIDRLVTVTAGGMAGASAPALFAGGAQRTGNELVRDFAPVEAGIVGDVAVTVWEPADSGPYPAS